MKDCQDKLSSVVGSKVVRASSSLNQLAVEFSGDKCLFLDVNVSEDGPSIEPTVTDASKFPSEGDVVCKVDWSWISGGELTDIKTGVDQFRLILAPQGPITVSAGVWQGKPFLSFMPYKAPTK
jgi:hypothetical protein